MTKFDVIVKEIYFQIAAIKKQDQEPYYLFLSKEIYQLIKMEMVALKANHLLQEGGRLDFFENMEVVPLSGTPVDFIEIRGIKINHVV